MAASLNITARVKDSTKAGLDSANRRVGRLSGKIGGLGKVAKIAAVGIAAIGIAGVAIGVKLISGLLKTGDALDKMNKRTGIAVEELSAMKFAVEQGGATLESFEKGLGTFAKGLGDATLKGTGPLVDGLELVGVSLTDIQDLDPIAQFDFLADAIAGVEDPVLRSAAAQKIFGKSGKDLLPTLLEGSEGLALLRQEARDTGNVMSGESARGAAKFNDAINTAKNFLSGLVLKGFNLVLPKLLEFGELLKRNVGPVIENVLLPAFRAIGAVLKDVVVPIIRDVLLPAFARIWSIAFAGVVRVWNDSLKPAISQIIALFGGGEGGEGGGSSLTGILNALKKTFSIVFAVVAVVVELAIAKVVNIIALVINTLVGVITFFKAIFTGDWSAAWDAIKEIVNGFIKFFKDEIKAVLNFITGIWDVFGAGLVGIVGGIWEKIKAGANRFIKFFKEDIPNGIKAAVNVIIGVIEALPNSYARAFNAIISAWNNFSISTPAVRILGKTIIPSVHFQTPDIPHIPLVSIPRLQAGGIVTRRTVVELGERGPEAVIPLGRLGRGLGATVVNVTVEGSVLTERDLERVVSNILTKLARQRVA